MIVISGGRDRELLDSEYLLLGLLLGWYGGPVLVGDCPTGVDKCVRNHVHPAKVGVFEADWDKYGPWAGPTRNTQMLKTPGVNLLVAFPGAGESRGTRNCISQARGLGIPVAEFPVSTPSQEQESGTENSPVQLPLEL